MKTENSMTISVIKNIGDLESIRSFWEELQWYPYTVIDYYINVISKQQGFIKPYIIVVKKNGTPVTLLIARVKDDVYNLKIGYKVLYKVPVNILEILYGGILGDSSNMVLELIIGKINESLKKKEFNVAFFKYIDIRKEYYQYLHKCGSIFTRDSLKVINPHWKLRIPDSFEIFLDERSKSTRDYIKRYTRRFEKRMKGRFELKSFTQPSDLETILMETDKIASQTYQRALNVGMRNNEETRYIYSYLLKNNMLATWIIYIDGEPAAFWTGIVFKRLFLSSATGFLPKYKTERIGTYLLMRMIGEFCKSKKVDVLDFGFGYADYKKKYSSEKLEESSITLYAPTLRGLYLKLIKTLSRIVIVTSKYLINKFGFLKILKKKWRHRLIHATN